MKTGIIILSHGSRLPEAQVTLHKIKSMISSGVPENYLVESAALQFNQPDLPAAISNLIDLGAAKVIIVPFFLYLGLHMQRDIPEIIDQEKKRYTGIDIFMTEHIGTDPRLLDIIMDRIKGVSS